MNIKGIAWLGIVSDDPAAREFYARILHLRVLEEAPTYAYYAIDEHARLEIVSNSSETAKRQRQDSPAIGFLVDDLEAGMRALEDGGVALRSEVNEWRSTVARHRWVYFADPAGNVLLLLERHGDDARSVVSPQERRGRSTTAQ
jgi:catechol 2,3-dioxygenase-like lactoylglutathione lyase family enzyme